MKKNHEALINFDKVLEHIGSFGRYQYFAVTLLCAMEITPGMHAMASVLEAAVPAFECDTLGGDTNGTTSSHQEEYEKDTCKLFYSGNTVPTNGSTDGAYGNMTGGNFCNRLRYDSSVFSSTIVTEWDLVCNKAWLRSFSTSMFMLGNLIGVIAFGHIADRFGRKCLFWANLLLVVVGSAVAFAPNVWLYSVLRLATGALTMGIVAITFTHGIEIVGLEHRVLVGEFASSAFGVGIGFLAFLGYFIRDYFWLQLTISLFALVFLPPLFWVGESPRWMLRQGKLDEAEREIKRMARINGREIPENLRACSEFLVDTSKEKPEEILAQNILTLLKLPRMRWNTINIWCNWMVVSLVYYGLSLGASDLAGNTFLNLALVGLVELPAYFLGYPVIQRLGRKPALSGSHLIGGAICLLMPVIPSGTTWLIILATVAGKFFAAVAFGDIYIYTAENYPTPVRAIGLGAGSMFARVGSILAPVVADMSSSVWKPMTQVVFGSLSILTACLSLMLPETRGRKLPETMEDGERLARTGLRCGRSNTTDGETNDKLENNENDKEVELCKMNGPGRNCNV